MAIRKLVSRACELAGNDLENIVQVVPIGSTVDLSVATPQYLEYTVMYGPVVPRLKVLPEILRGLRQRFRGRVVEMTPTRNGLTVKVSKLGAVQ